MPIVTRNGVQYQLEGPNDVPSSGNRIGPVPGIPPVGGFGQGAPFASTGTRRVDLPGGGYTLVPQSTYGDPSLYENSISKTAAAPGQTFAPNLGSWAPPTPEYLTAPGYETYAPTAAYGYSPTGGDWSGGFGSGGGGGGDLASGDFGGGGDNSTLGGLLSAASLLGGANDLSSLLTGKGLLEHAGIENPFSGLLGSEGSGANAFGTPNPSTGNLLSNTLDLFGSNLSASADLGLPSLARALEISNATGGLGPTGELFSGLPNVNSFPGTQTFSGGTAPLQGNLGHLADFSDFAPSLEGAAPSVPGGNVFGEIKGVSEPWGSLSQSQASAAAGQALNQAAMASLFPGAAASTSALLAAPGFSAAIPSMGGALAGVAGPAAGAAGAAGAGAGGLAGLGAAGPMALAAAAFMAMQAMKDPPDPTLNTRRLNQIENMMQKGGGGITALEQFLYNEPYTLDLIKDVTSGSGKAEPFGTPHTSGGTKLISWSPNVSKKVQENMHLLEKASHAGQVAGSQGMDTPPKQAAYSDIKRGATFNAANDPFGHREREAAMGGEFGEITSYVPSGRDLFDQSGADEGSI